MFARLTLLEIDTVRVSMDEALDQFRNEVAPRFVSSPAICGVFVFSTPEGKGALLSLWETEEQAATEGDHEFYGQVLEKLRDVLPCRAGPRALRGRVRRRAGPNRVR